MQIAVTAALTVTGLWLANSLSRKTRAERQVAVINKRFEVYPELWKATAGAAPMDEVIGGPALNQDQRDLYEAMAEWLWERGGGMVLGEPSRTIYLQAKENLKLSTDKLWPESVAEDVRAAVDKEKALSQVSPGANFRCFAQRCGPIWESSGAPTDVGSAPSIRTSLEPQERSSGGAHGGTEASAIGLPSASGGQDRPFGGCRALPRYFQPAPRAREGPATPGRRQKPEQLTHSLID